MSTFKNETQDVQYYKCHTFFPKFDFHITYAFLLSIVNIYTRGESYLQYHAGYPTFYSILKSFYHSNQPVRTKFA